MASGHGENCTYCKREMRTDVEKHHPLFATGDHFIPKSKVNGNPNKKVWACYQCNQLKADRFPEQWERFMRRNPRWWEHPLLNDGFWPLPKLPRSAPAKPKPPPWQETCRFLREANERAALRKTGKEICPVLIVVANELARIRYGVWRPQQTPLPANRTGADENSGGNCPPTLRTSHDGAD